MMTFSGIAEAADAARLWFLVNQGSLPEHVAGVIAPYAGTGGSPVDLAVNFAEAVYANREDPALAGALSLAGGCALLGETFGFHGLNLDSRGSQIALVLDGQVVAEPPEPRAELAAPTE